MKTSGPVYGVEEVEVGRATCLSVLYELASHVNSWALKRSLFKFVNICVDVLRHDEGRNVRRAAGLLARAIMARAVDEVGDGITHGVLLEEFERLGVERLKASLESAAGGGWGGGREGTDSRVLGNGGVHVDEALRVRCKEALELWEEVEKAGGWQWGRVRWAKEEGGESGSVGLLKRMLNKGEQAGADVKKEFGIDTETLMLNT